VYRELWKLVERGAIGAVVETTNRWISPRRRCGTHRRTRARQGPVHLVWRRQFPRGYPLTSAGLIAVSTMLIAYALEDRSRTFVLVFAAACAASSAYGFLAGTWPFGVVEAVWTAVLVVRVISDPDEAGAGQISRRSRPRITVPLKCRRAASVHIASVTSGSSGGTKCESTSVLTPALAATRPASSADV
jgi:hypothetical protein